MNIRKIIFNILRKKDAEIIKCNIEELRNNIDSPNKTNKIKLEKFIDYVTKESNYYLNYKGKNITEFPVMNKTELANNMENIITNTVLNNKKLYVRKTSGSYGTPFKFHVTRSKILSQQSQILYFGQWSRFDIGVRHLYLRSIDPNLKNKIFKNQYIIKPEKITEEWLNESIREISKVKPKVIIGYPTTLESLAQKINENAYHFDFIEGIITSGETMTENAKNEIKAAFNLIPLSRYSTEELGVLANTKPEDNNMILNQVDFHIEILNAEGNPVDEGEIGKVIVTDFNSHILPLVRYDTGDLAKVSRYNNGLAIEISHIEGRQVEMIYDTNGNIVSPYTINSRLRGNDYIKQFQFIQESTHEYVLKLIIRQNVYKNKFNKLINQFKSILGESSEIRIEYVDEISALPSGKRPYIINKLIS